MSFLTIFGLYNKCVWYKISKASTSIKDKANELLHSSSDHEMNAK